ncbi:hypothetical protein FOF52_02995 [Thermobifida alba]|jgi:hypothetical protein|uniref:DUF998 domain-containing protein n=1 Tax=Thermobifida alba TaxID=53522 RepID=A0ABY4KYC3_THEAE|nr:hypothetical protein [Thermobifida alba]UPT20065.1 hypothetical protein FOF52_02995 [Thermobifida alba]
MTMPALRATRVLTVLGLVLTLALGLWPFMTPDLLADHIQHGYPDYTDAEVGAAVNTWQVALATVAGLGVIGWIWTLVTLRQPHRWAPFSATALLAVALIVAVVLITTPDTSGEVGLVPVMGWAWLAPCVVGIVVTGSTWRIRRAASPSR